MRVGAFVDTLSTVPVSQEVVLDDRGRVAKKVVAFLSHLVVHLKMTSLRLNRERSLSFRKRITEPPSSVPQ